MDDRIKFPDIRGRDCMLYPHYKEYAAPEPPSVPLSKSSTMPPVTDNEFVAAFYDHVQEALYEAAKHNIQANAIAISDKLLYSKIESNTQDVPMILGLKCVYSDELPDDSLFAIFEGKSLPQTIVERNMVLEAENQRLRNKLIEIVNLIEGPGGIEG